MNDEDPTSVNCKKAEQNARTTQSAPRVCSSTLLVGQATMKRPLKNNAPT